MIYQAIVALPLISCLFAALLGRNARPAVTHYMTISLVGLAAILSWIAFLDHSLFFGLEEASGSGSASRITFNPSYVIPIAVWFSLADISIELAIRVDTLTAALAVAVTSISAFVHIFSIGYMKAETGQNRYFSLLSLITFATLIATSANSFVQVILGWHLVSISIYLLVGFREQRPSSRDAALKTYLFQTFGDVCILIGALSLFHLFGSDSFAVLDGEALGIADQPLSLWGVSFSTLTLATVFILTGIMAKSALFLFGGWLEDSAEAPAPALAMLFCGPVLVLGVHLLTRLAPLFEHSDTIGMVMVLIGTATVLYGSSVALVLTDAKKIFVHVACSQIGIAFTALGFGAYNVAVLHVFIFSFVNCLFILSGCSVLKVLSFERDIRKMGGLKKALPVTYTCALIGVIAGTGIGIPVLSFGASGFYSLYGALKVGMLSLERGGLFLFLIILFSVGLLVFVQWRFLFVVFHGESRMPADIKSHIREPGGGTRYPLLSLAGFSLFLGIPSVGAFIDSRYDQVLGQSIAVLSPNELIVRLEKAPFYFDFVPFLTILAGGGLVWLLCVRSPERTDELVQRWPAVERFLECRWYLADAFSALLMKPLEKCVDGVLFVFGGELFKTYRLAGFSRNFKNLSMAAAGLQRGSYRQSSIIMTLAIFLLSTLFVISGGERLW